MKRLWLLILLIAPLATYAQQVVVGGNVVDDKTGDPLGQVSISAGRVSVVTNEDGDFSLKLTEDPGTIIVSHLGYKTKRVKVKNGEELKVRLQPTTIRLREVVVMNEDPRELVDIAIRKIPDNYSKVPELLKGFYRETAMKRKHYIYVAEGVEDMYKTPYNRSIGRDRVAIVKGRRLLSQKQGDTLGVKVMGGPVQAVVMDLVKNRDFLLNKEDLDVYKFTMGIPEYINDRLQYVVQMEPLLAMPYALYHGKLYIDSERLAFTRIELSLDMTDKDKATRTMLVKKPLGVKFKPRELSSVVDYRYEDGVTRISYLRNTFRFNCDWKKRLFATSFTATCEMVVTDSSSGDVQPIASRSSFDSRDAYYDKVEYFMDPDYWRSYNIIEPSESWCPSTAGIKIERQTMKKILTTLFAVCSLVGLQAQTDMFSNQSQDSVAVVLPWPQNIQARLDTLMQDPLLETTQLGLMVYDLTADSVLYRHGERQVMRPASTMKLVTAVTAIDVLGSNYQYRTALQYKGTVKDSVLIGDLYCVGCLDPMFDNAHMNAFVESVRALGVDSIHGQLVAVDGFKDADLQGEGWCWDDDNPQLSPLLVSQKNEFMSVFVQRLREAGIALDAPCTTGSLPKGTLTICSVNHSLRDILYPMLKDSDNLFAESVFYQIAASQGVRPAKAAHARQIEKRVLAKAGVQNVQYRIADGSGLSLYNYVTPELLTRLLIYAYRNTNIFMNLYPSLPIAGQDGTLKKRMTEPVTNGRVKAKTGTVSGISSLAGYLTAANNHVLAFCIINQGVMKNSDGRGFQDRVCTALCER